MPLDTGFRRYDGKTTNSPTDFSGSWGKGHLNTPRNRAGMFMGAGV